ncbi:MAG: ABC transporter permease [Gemmatimonadaceae bacterium]
MTDYRRIRPRGASERWFRLLLTLYPRDFRQLFGDEMIAFFRDRLRHERATRGTRGVIGLWARTLRDLVIHAPLERLDAAQRSTRRRQEIVPYRQAHSTLHNEEDRMMSSIVQDLKYAARGMLRAPAFLAVVLTTLALGIGANAAIFSVVRAILLQPLPYQDPDALVEIAHEEPYGSVSEPEFVDYQRETRALERLAALRTPPVTLTGDGEPEQIRAAAVSDGFFRIMGVAPQLGRTFLPEEDRRGAADVVVLSHGLWQRRYGADPAIVGKQIVINSRPRTVVGVMPRQFAYPSRDVAVWAPLRLNYDTLWTRNNHYLRMVGRVAPGSTLERASAELNLLARRFTRDFPETYAAGNPLVVKMTRVNDALVGKTRPYLYALLGAVGFVLVIACVNVANLLLVRGESRRKEVAIRTALGASRSRLMRLVLTEGALYALAGGAFGLLVALLGVKLLVTFAPPDTPRLAEVRVDTAVLLFTLGITMLTGLLFGIVPAFTRSRDSSSEALKEGGKTTGQARGLARVRRTLVVSEVALAVVALAGATLMLRSLWNLHRIDLGFTPARVLSLRLSLPVQKYPDDAPARFYDELLGRVRALPGVRAAGAVGDLPIADGNSMWSILIDGAPMTSVAESPSAMPQQVTPGYLESMGIALVRGRTFVDADRADAPLVAVVNETMAREHWPGKNAIGGTIKMLNDEAPWATVVGVVTDVRSSGFLERVPPTMYFPLAQAGRSAYFTPAQMNVVVKTDGDPLAIAPRVRALVREMEPMAPLSRVQSMEQVVAASVAARRFATQLLSAFAALAVVLAGVGIYGVISFGVTQRTFEIGLRLALGAQRHQVLRLVVSEGVRLALVGVALGLIASLAVTRVLRAVFVDVTPGDPWTLVSVMLVLVAVAFVASYVPARRASGIDPIGALRAE